MVSCSYSHDLFIYLHEKVSCLPPHGTCVCVCVFTYLIGQASAVLLGSVDERLIQIHHQHQFPVPMQPLLVLSTQQLGLLLRDRQTEMGEHGQVTH